jgi:hypothetical protein
MSYHIKFLSLNKAELEYEVAVRGETPASTVQDLRKQISKLSTLFPSEDVLYSCFNAENDLLGIKTVIAKISSVLDSDELPDKSTLMRTQNLMHHVYHRLNRIETDDTKNKSIRDSFIIKFKEYYKKYNSIKDNVVDLLDVPTTELDTSSPLNIKVSCDRGISNEITKMKFDGKTCVRTFIQRVSEFCKARSIDDSKLLAYGTEIFNGGALHWYRSIKDDIKNWSDLVILLRRDFDQADYDYRLISEIRSRTQGETENITIYLSIMAGMFSRLSKPLSEEERLEIILHNIRPTYTSTLAAVAEVKDIESLKSICRNYENFQARLAHFHEPAKPTANTVAPEFAYAGSSNQNKYFQKQNYNQNINKTNNTYYRENNNKQNFKFSNNNNKQNYYNKNSNYENLDSINDNSCTQGQRKRFCPRCRVDTHNLRQCTANKDSIFCFVCGRKDVKTPQCPDCSKNRQSSSNSKN